MKVTETKLKGCFIIEPKIWEDQRGWFMESFNKAQLNKLGILLKNEFVQDNHAFNKEKGTLRGIHFQREPQAQSKLVRCTRGAIYDVAVDLRVDSPTYKEWVGMELTENNKTQFFVPKGFGHGYLTLMDNTEIQYKTDNYYASELDGAIFYDDPELAIDWKINNPILSEKDKLAKHLKDVEVGF